MSLLKWILSLIIVSLITIVCYGMSSQTNNGDGNVQNQGNNNTIDNHAKIKRTTTNRPTGQIIINNSTVTKDLESGNYKDLRFEEKKTIHPPRKRVLVVTATNYETGVFHEVAKKLNIPIQKDIIQDHIVYSFGEVGGVDVFHMQPGMMGMAEPGSTPFILMSVFRDLRPDYIIATGIAFGRQSKGHSLGDILISRQVVNYESRKETNGDIIFRGDKVTSNMLERINGGIHNWKGAPVHDGLILSGNALVNSQKFLDYLSKREPEFSGGEMEAYSAYAVASMMKAQWIMIKGISDWGDGTKNDKYHHIALENASKFIFHVIQDGNLK